MLEIMWLLFLAVGVPKCCSATDVSSGFMKVHFQTLEALFDLVLFEMIWSEGKLLILPIHCTLTKHYQSPITLNEK